MGNLQQIDLYGGPTSVENLPTPSHRILNGDFEGEEVYVLEVSRNEYRVLVANGENMGEVLVVGVAELEVIDDEVEARIKEVVDSIREKPKKMYRDVVRDIAKPEVVLKRRWSLKDLFEKVNVSKLSDGVVVRGNRAGFRLKVITADNCDYYSDIVEVLNGSRGEVVVCNLDGSNVRLLQGRSVRILTK